jgi:sec-independent protein translocase protein TatA
VGLEVVDVHERLMSHAGRAADSRIQHDGAVAHADLDPGEALGVVVGKRCRGLEPERIAQPMGRGDGLLVVDEESVSSLTIRRRLPRRRPAMNLGGPELLIVLVVVLLLFGAKKVPDLARSLGQAKREFEQAGRQDTA